MPETRTTPREAAFFTENDLAGDRKKEIFKAPTRFPELLIVAETLIVRPILPLDGPRTSRTETFTESGVESRVGVAVGITVGVAPAGTVGSTGGVGVAVAVGVGVGLKIAVMLMLSESDADPSLTETITEG